MIIHKDKARDTYCPMKFAAIGVLKTHGAAMNWPNAIMNQRGSEMSYCSAENCMAWRWENFQTGQGYCGMAGEPIGIPKTTD